MLLAGIGVSIRAAVTLPTCLLLALDENRNLALQVSGKSDAGTEVLILQMSYLLNLDIATTERSQYLYSLVGCICKEQNRSTTLGPAVS